MRVSFSSAQLRQAVPTDMQAPERTMAFAGIRKTGWTRDQIREYGNVLSRDTAQSVREHVVAILMLVSGQIKTGEITSSLPLATRLAKKQKAKMAMSTDAAAYEPVPW